MSKYLLDELPPSERRIQIGTTKDISQYDYDLVRGALEELVSSLRFESRDAQDRLTVTHLVPRSAEIAYANALKILIRTPGHRQPVVTK